MPVLVQKPFQVRHIALDVMASAGPEWTTTSAGRFQSRFPPLFNDLSICQMCALTLLNYDARLAELCHNEHSRLLSSKASRGNERDLCEETRNIPPLKFECGPVLPAGSHASKPHAVEMHSSSLIKLLRPPRSIFCIILCIHSR